MKVWFNKVLSRCVIAVVLAFSHLPLRVLYLFSNLTKFVMHRVLRYRLKVVRSNLELAFPEKTEKERRDIENRFYRHFADYIFETIKSTTISKKELLTRMVIVNPEVVNKFCEQKRPVMIYGGHFGNWEWFNTFPDYFPSVRIYTFYQPQKNYLTNYLTLYTRTRDGITAIESNKGYRGMVTVASQGQGGVTLILGDQCPHRTAKKLWVKDFFGIDTPFLVGTDRIAKKTKQVLVFPSFIAYERGRYTVEMKVIEEFPQDVESTELIERYAKLLEADIRRIPELWLWSHRRWKLKHENFPDE